MWTSSIVTQYQCVQYGEAQHPVFPLVVETDTKAAVEEHWLKMRWIFYLN